MCCGPWENVGLEMWARNGRGILLGWGVADRKDGNYTVFATFGKFIWMGDLRKHTQVRTHTQNDIRTLLVF